MPRPRSALSRSSTPSSPQKLKRKSYVPVPAALNMTNGAGSVGMAPTSSAGSTSSARSSASNSNGNKHGGVFFGSSDQAAAKHAARVASAASGTGKVLSDLQFELSTARGALETTKNTLRITQTAVDNLSRDREELTSHRDSLRLENEGLSKMLARKDRMLAEAKDQAKEQARLAEECTAKAATLESQAEEMNARTTRAESEYEALRGGLQSAKEGWEKQVHELKTSQEEMQKRHAQQLADALQTQRERTSRAFAAITISDALTDQIAPLVQYGL